MLLWFLHKLLSVFYSTRTTASIVTPYPSNDWWEHLRLQFKCRCIWMILNSYPSSLFLERVCKALFFVKFGNRVLYDVASGHSGKLFILCLMCLLRFNMVCISLSWVMWVNQFDFLLNLVNTPARRHGRWLEANKIRLCGGRQCDSKELSQKFSTFAGWQLKTGLLSWGFSGYPPLLFLQEWLKRLYV